MESSSQRRSERRPESEGEGVDLAMEKAMERASRKLGLWYPADRRRARERGRGQRGVGTALTGAPFVGGCLESARGLLLKTTVAGACDLARPRDPSRYVPSPQAPIGGDDGSAGRVAMEEGEDSRQVDPTRFGVHAFSVRVVVGV